MKKKIFAMLLAAVFAASFFAGCAKTDETDTSMPTDTAVLTGTSAKQTEKGTDSSDNGSTAEDTTPITFSETHGDYPHYSNEELLKDRYSVFEATVEEMSFYVMDGLSGKVFFPPEQVNDYVKAVKENDPDQTLDIALVTVYTLKVTKPWKWNGTVPEKVRVLFGDGLKGTKEAEQIQAIRAVGAQEAMHYRINVGDDPTLEEGKSYLFSTITTVSGEEVLIPAFEDIHWPLNPVQGVYEIGSKEANDLIDFMKKNVKAGE